jgi:hypothetical protein
MKYFAIMKFYLEVVKFPGKQINAIEDCSGEAMKMAKDMPPMRRTPADAR